MLWDIYTGRGQEVLAGYSPGLPHPIAFSPDGSLLAAAGVDGTFKVYNVAAGHERTFPHEHALGVGPIAASADGALTAIGSRVGIRVWDVASWELQQTFPDPERVLRVVDGTPWGLVIADSTSQTEVEFWDAVSGEVVATIRTDGPIPGTTRSTTAERGRAPWLTGNDVAFNQRSALPHLVSYLSHSSTLLPGTVIMTGTSRRVGHFMDPATYLNSMATHSPPRRNEATRRPRFARNEPDAVPLV